MQLSSDVRMAASTQAGTLFAHLLPKFACPTWLISVGAQSVLPFIPKHNFCQYQQKSYSVLEGERGLYQKHNISILQNIKNN